MIPEKAHFQENLGLNQNTPEQLEKLKNDLKVKVDTLKADGSFSGEDLADLVDLLDDKTILSPTEAELKSHLESLQNLETQIDFLMALVDIGGESENIEIENNKNKQEIKENDEVSNKESKINIDEIDIIVTQKQLLDKNLNQITKADELIDVFNYLIKNEEIIIDRGISLGKETLNSLNTKNEFKNFLMTISDRLIKLSNQGKINLGSEAINGKIYLKLDKNEDDSSKETSNMKNKNESISNIIEKNNSTIVESINKSSTEIQELFDNIKLEDIDSINIEDFELFYSNLKEENLTAENIEKLVKISNLTTKSIDNNEKSIELLHDIDLLKVEPKIINKLLKIDGLKINTDNLGILDLSEVDINILVEFSKQNNIDLGDFSLGLSKKYGLSIFEVEKIIDKYNKGNKEKDFVKLLNEEAKYKEKDDLDININDIIDSSGNIKLENKTPEEKLQILENIIKFIKQNNKKGNNEEGLSLKLIENIISKDLLYNKDFDDREEFNEKINSLDGQLLENIGQNINSIKIAFNNKEYFEGFFGSGFEIISMLAKNEVKNSKEYIDLIIENNILQKIDDDNEGLTFNSGILNITNDIETTNYIIEKFENKFPNKEFFSEIAPKFFNSSEITSLKAFLKRNISGITDINKLTYINEEQNKILDNLKLRLEKNIEYKINKFKEDNKGIDIENNINNKEEKIRKRIKTILGIENNIEDIYNLFKNYFENNKINLKESNLKDNKILEIIDIFLEEAKIESEEKIRITKENIESGEISQIDLEIIKKFKKDGKIDENLLLESYENYVKNLQGNFIELQGPIQPGNIKQAQNLIGDNNIQNYVESLGIQDKNLKSNIITILSEKYKTNNTPNREEILQGIKEGKTYQQIVLERNIIHYAKLTNQDPNLLLNKLNPTETQNNSTNFSENISSGEYTLDTSNSVIKTEYGKNISLNQEEINMIQKNPDTMKNIINLYESLERVGLRKLWNYKEDIFKSLENVFRVQFDRKDGNYLDERETKILLNAVLTSLGEKPIKTDKKIDNFLSEIENINGRQVTGAEKEVNKLGESRLEASFIEKFVGRGDMIGFKQSAFEDSLKKIN